MIENPNLQQVLGTVISIVFTALLGILTYAIKQALPLITEWIDHKVELERSKISKENLAIIDGIVAKAVQTAEQSAEIGVILKTAEAKKNYALQIIQKSLEDRNIPFDVVDAARQIEAAINQGLQEKPMGLGAITSEPLMLADKER